MLAYPTPTFDAKTIRSAPGYRPVGKAGCTVPSDEPVAETPLNLVNKHTTNGGFVGSRAKHFIQNNQFLNEHYDPVKGSPLSKVGSVGNVGDQFISAGRPYMAEPKNEELRLIMNILDGKPIAEEQKGRLTAKQVRAMGEKTEILNQRPPSDVDIIGDLADAQEAMKRTNRINNAIAQGFTREEAEKAYNKLREKEAESALFKQQDVSTRLYDLIDSRVGGIQSGNVAGNDESALFLAEGRNRVMFNTSQQRDTQADKAVEGQMVKVKGFKRQGIPRAMPVTGALKEFIHSGQPIVIPREKPLLRLEDKQEEPILEIKSELTKAIESGGSLKRFDLRRVPTGRPKGAKDTYQRVRGRKIKE